MSIVSAIVVFLRAFLVPRAAIAAENLCLRQQLAVRHQSVRRPRLRQRDWVFWVWPSRLLTGWRSCLVIVQPGTVIRWHRQGFKLSWRWQWSASKPIPRLDASIPAQGRVNTLLSPPSRAG